MKPLKMKGIKCSPDSRFAKRCDTISFVLSFERNEKFEAKTTYGKRSEAKNLFRFKAKRKIRSETKQKHEKKLIVGFCLSMRKRCETDPVSLRFTSKRKKILSETGAP
jgi:hypothetical protein